MRATATAAVSMQPSLPKIPYGAADALCGFKLAKLSVELTSVTKLNEKVKWSTFGRLIRGPICVLLPRPSN